MGFSTPADVFGWLTQFINVEQGQSPSSFRAERMHVIAAVAGHPERCAPSIHVAGSKGKGSITAMVSAILDEAGMFPARYMSPHVTEYRERIMQDEKLFSDELYCAAGSVLQKLTEYLMNPREKAYALLEKASQGEKPDPTFFELLTIYFFLCAKMAGCRVLCVETGMGGRLDPTNIVDPEVAVITGVELEHTEFLGENVHAIAGEKAGIIKEGKPLVLGEQSDEALEVFRLIAEQRHAPLYYFPEVGSLSDVEVGKDGTKFRLVFKNDKFAGRPRAPLELQIPVPGEVQAKNAALAVMALLLAFPAVSDEKIARGLARLKIPARFERICDDPIIIIDGAHTNNSALHCVKTFSALYGDGGMLLFGCATGKNVAGMAAALMPHFSSVVITTPGTFKTSNPEAVFEVFEKNVKESASEVSSLDFIKKTGDAIKYVLETARAKKCPVLCVGSFYLASEVRRTLMNEARQK